MELNNNEPPKAKKKSAKKIEKLKGWKDIK